MKYKRPNLKLADIYEACFFITNFKSLNIYHGFKLIEFVKRLFYEFDEDFCVRDHQPTEFFSRFFNGP